MGRREELLRREAACWARLERATANLSDEEIARPGITADGWAVRDVWWHLAYWCEDTARVLREMRDGAWDGADPSMEAGWTDRVNDAEFERSRAMPVADVRAALGAARRRHLDALGALGEITPEAQEWFDESGPLHVDEHAADLETWAERLRAERT